MVDTLARTLACAVLAAALLAPGTASAQGGFYLGFGAGPALHIDSWPTQVRLEQEIGYYVEGRPYGFFLAFAPSQSFLDRRFVVVFTPRFGYMFEVYRGRDVTFTLGPQGTIPGFAITGCYDNDRCRDHLFFHFSVSFGMRLIFARGRVAVYLRPVEFEFAFGDRGSRDAFYDEDAVRYVLAGGLHFHL